MASLLIFCIATFCFTQGTNSGTTHIPQLWPIRWSWPLISPQRAHVVPLKTKILRLFEHPKKTCIGQAVHINRTPMWPPIEPPTLGFCIWSIRLSWVLCFRRTAWRHSVSNSFAFECYQQMYLMSVDDTWWCSVWEVQDVVYTLLSVPPNQHCQVWA